MSRSAISIKGSLERIACTEQRSGEREWRLRRRPDGREFNMSCKVGSLTGVERTSRSAAIREALDCLEPKRSAVDRLRAGVLVDLLNLFSRVEKTRAKELRNAILLS